MSKITFDRTESDFRILNPFKDFVDEVHRVEVRKDPLLKDTSVYNPYLRDKVKAFFGENDQELLRKLVEDGAKNCIFCPEKVGTVTAKYPPDVLPEGRITRGEATLFANVFSVGKYHPVVALSKAHFLKLSEFSPEIIANGFLAAQDFLKIISRRDPSAAYTTINANYLFPAGASLVHPHLQMLVTPEAYTYHGRMLDACRQYHEKNGSSYFADLIAEERKQSVRYVAQRGGWHWLAAFSPLGSNEFLAVHEQESDFGDLPESEIQLLALGISKVLVLYENLGHLSFNYSLFSVRSGTPAPGFRCVLTMVNRQNLYPNYRSDDYFLQKLLQTELILNLPEDLAERLRALF
jgi:galactose-1-phosphate uridylyltransferase